MNHRLGLLVAIAVSAFVAAPVAALPSFEITSTTGGSNLPFTIGMPFRQGDVPSGSDVVGSNGSLQVIAKNRWPDGSMKIAVISGRATLSPNSPSTISLNLGTAPGGAALTTANLRATNITASIGAGGFGSASWANADFDSPFLTWVTGPEMSSWIYRKPIGSDAHLVGWLEIRLYAGGAVEVLPWVENGYLRVASPTNKNATYTFTLSGSQRFSQAFDLLNHQRAVLASGSTLSHWIGTDPQIVPKHDTNEFQATKLVPMYSGNTSNGSSLWSRITQTYTPLAQAGYPSVMGTTGYHGSIGPLPEWDVVYLTSRGDPRAYRGIIVHGYCAGRYGLHFRDETTNRPPRFTSYPTLVLGAGSGVTATGASTTNSYTPDATGSTPPTWAESHHPSLGYMAYLLTGRFYFMEQTEFVATVSYLKQNDGGQYANRQGSKGILRTDAGANTTRGAAWALRSLIQAATVTPDGDPLRAEYVTSFEENVSYYHQLYINTANNNPQGVCAPYTDYTPTPPYMHSMWMEDFLTFAFGFGKDVVPMSSTASSRLDAFLGWKYQSIVGRLGGAGATEYCYRDAAQYNTAVAPTDAAQWDGTDPASNWYSNWGQMYSATVGHANDCGSGSALRGNSGADPALFDGYWGNLLPAIAYAVDHGASGAAAGYARLTGASNYATGAATLNDTPVWGVRPRNASTPGGDTTPPSRTTNLIVR